MRWEGGRESDNVEDRGGMPGGPVMIGGGLGMLLLVMLLSVVFGIDPQQVINQLPQQGQVEAPGPGPDGPQQDDEATARVKRFVRVVLADTEDVWHDLFRRMGRQYRDPRLILFRGQVQSQCGFASAQVGPFYCPLDEQVYLDVSFFDQLREQFHAPGEFAQAYVIAHEIGHHVQKQLGIFDQVNAMRGRISEREYNHLSVRLELQADFLAGVWAHHAQRARNILERGDVETALNAASAIGDDRLQKQSRGYVVPDSFTHGTSEQRVHWFRKGLETGDITQGDTFNTDNL